MYYFAAVNLLVFGYVGAMVVFLISLSGFSCSNFGILNYLHITTNWYWGSVLSTISDFREKRNIHLFEKKQRITINKKSFTTLWNNAVIRKIIIIILVSTLLFSVDRQIQLFSPSIQLADVSPAEKYVDKIEVYRTWDNSFVYYHQMTETYWIKLPISAY